MSSPEQAAPDGAAVTALTAMTAVSRADPFQVRMTDLADGLLADFQSAGVLTAADVHVAIGLRRLSGETDDRVLLALALAVRAARLGSVCVDLAAAPTQIAAEDPLDAGAPAGSDTPQLPWPEPAAWLAALQSSRLVDPGPERAGGRPLQLSGELLYLDRYWRQEELVAAELVARERRSVERPPQVDETLLQAALERLFASGPEPGEPDLQRTAAEVVARRWITVLAGGPGTGKTTTVARVLALLTDQPGPRLHIALAAPTGKAATRLEEAVHEAVRHLTPRDQERLQGLSASTLHRLLGSFGSGSRFRHHAGNRLPHDIVVVDESSMISLTMMARLLDAVRPDARLVLVGDPEQLASVDAGAVLGDIVDAARSAESMAGEPGAGPEGSLPPALASRGIVVLDRSWRFDGLIAQLARAVRAGDVDRTFELLHTPSPDLSFIPADVLSAPSGPGGGGPLTGLRDDVVEAARGLLAAAKSCDAGGALERLGDHRLLCAHRSGPYGVDRWSQELERWIAAALVGYRGAGEWYPGPAPSGDRQRLRRQPLQR